MLWPLSSWCIWRSVGHPFDASGAVGRVQTADGPGVTRDQGRTQGGGARPSPLDLKKHYIFRVSSVKLRDLHL